MKKTYLLALICIVCASCSKDDAFVDNIQSQNKKIETLNFPSYEKMDAKVDEISQIKAQMEKSTAEKYISIKHKSTENNSEDAVIESLKNYHNDRLNDIYDLRKKTNFISIQSIADEINSLTLINPAKSNELFKEYEKYLVKEDYEIKTVFENRTSNVINKKGEVLINRSLADFKIPTSNKLTGRYVYDESIKTGKAVIFNNASYFIEYSAGREKHKDDFGRTFFRYFTEFKSYINTRRGPILYPATFNVESTSIAGFSQSGSAPFSAFAFSMQYPSGIGSSIRNTGGQKRTAYQPEGGNIKGTFKINISNRYGNIEEFSTCNFKYTR